MHLKTNKKVFIIVTSSPTERRGIMHALHGGSYNLGEVSTFKLRKLLHNTTYLNWEPYVSGNYHHRRPYDPGLGWVGFVFSSIGAEPVHACCTRIKYIILYMHGYIIYKEITSTNSLFLSTN